VSQVFKGPLSGQLFETLVLGEVVRNFYNSGKIPRIFWWRTSSGQEVDFIIEDRGKLIPIEVKLTTKSDPRIIKGLHSFCEIFRSRVKEAYLINLSTEKIILGEGILSLPFFKFVTDPLVKK
ncbi:MAG: DUF4143 domain-containing protein, partial [Candidatus Omnitrophota bacterium]